MTPTRPCLVMPGGHRADGLREWGVQRVHQARAAGLRAGGHPHRRVGPNLGSFFEEAALNKPLTLQDNPGLKSPSELGNLSDDSPENPDYLGMLLRIRGFSQA